MKARVLSISSISVPRSVFVTQHQNQDKQYLHGESSFLRPGQYWGCFLHQTQLQVQGEPAATDTLLGIATQIWGLCRPSCTESYLMPFHEKEVCHRTVPGCLFCDVGDLIVGRQAFHHNPHACSRFRSCGLRRQAYINLGKFIYRPAQENNNKSKT